VTAVAEELEVVEPIRPSVGEREAMVDFESITTAAADAHLVSRVNLRADASPCPS
jgi:hypothetical protein